jgi:hypothetical protein
MKKTAFILTLVCVSVIAYGGKWNRSEWDNSQTKTQNLTIDGNVRLPRAVGSGAFTTTGLTVTISPSNGTFGDNPIAIAIPTDTSGLDTSTIWVESATETAIVFKRFQALPSGQTFNWFVFGK